MAHAPHTQFPSKCTRCHNELHTPVYCQVCDTMQPVQSGISYFTLFNLPIQFDLDPAELQRRYFALNRGIHPDMQAQGDAAQGELALQHSARINQAYRVLSDPVRRLEHLLDLFGGPDSAADKSVPKELLSKIIMWREQIEEAKSAGDQSTLAALKAPLLDARQVELDQAAALARKLTIQAPPADQTRLRQLLNGLKYFDNLLATLA